MGRFVAVAAILLLAAAGCLGSGLPLEQRLPTRTVVLVQSTTVEPAPLGPDEFYFVVIAGAEQVHHVSEGSPPGTIRCNQPDGYSYDASNRRLEYDPAAFPLEVETLRVVVALDYGADRVGRKWIEQGCATQNDLEGFSGRASFEGKVRPDLRADVVVETRDGFLSFNESVFVPMGQKVVVNLTRVETRDYGTFFVTGEFTVANLGAWKRADVVPRGGPNATAPSPT